MNWMSDNIKLLMVIVLLRGTGIAVIWENIPFVLRDARWHVMGSTGYTEMIRPYVFCVRMCAHMHVGVRVCM